MKICYLCADLGVPVGGRKGASAHVRGLVRAFSALGHEVLLVTPSAGGDEDGALGARVVPVPVSEIAADLASASDPRLVRALGHLWNNAAVERVLREVLPSSGAEVVYERYSPFGVAGGLMGKRLGVPHVLEVNAPLAWEGRRYRRQALPEAAELLEQAVFDSTALIIAVSAQLREALIGAGVPASKVVAVPNGVDAGLFSPEGEVFEDGLEGKLVLGFVGSLKAWHGVELLAEAFRRLAADPRFHLLVVGKGPQARLIESLARELPGRVTLAGAVPHREVPRYLRAMDIALAPYPPLERFYFSPLKVLEYMAAGRAVVASSLGQVAEVLRQGETGLLVEPGNPAALVEAIRALAGDQGLRRALGAAAAREARRAHLWTQRAARILELIGGLS